MQQLGIFAERNEKRLVLGPDHARKELRGGIALDINQPFLARADVNQQSQGDGQIRFTREALDRLRFAVLFDSEVTLLQVGNQFTLLGFHVEEDVDQIDVNFNDLILIRWRLLLSEGKVSRLPKLLEGLSGICASRL